MIAFLLLAAVLIVAERQGWIAAIENIVPLRHTAAKGGSKVKSAIKNVQPVAGAQGTQSDYGRRGRPNLRPGSSGGTSSTSGTSLLVRKSGGIRL